MFFFVWQFMAHSMICMSVQPGIRLMHAVHRCELISWYFHSQKNLSASRHFLTPGVQNKRNLVSFAVIFLHYKALFFQHYFPLSVCWKLSYILLTAPSLNLFQFNFFRGFCLRGFLRYNLFGQFSGSISVASIGLVSVGIFLKYFFPLRKNIFLNRFFA